MQQQVMERKRKKSNKKRHRRRRTTRGRGSNDMRRKRKEEKLVRQLVSWCFEPSQPQRITSGLGGQEERGHNDRKRQTDRQTEKDHEKKGGKKEAGQYLDFNDLSTAQGHLRTKKESEKDKNGNRWSCQSHKAVPTIYNADRKKRKKEKR